MLPRNIFALGCRSQPSPQDWPRLKASYKHRRCRSILCPAYPINLPAPEHFVEFTPQYLASIAVLYMATRPRELTIFFIDFAQRLLKKCCCFWSEASVVIEPTEMGSKLTKKDRDCAGS
jgi:hypothetical protein